MCVDVTRASLSGGLRGGVRFDTETSHQRLPSFFFILFHLISFLSLFFYEAAGTCDGKGRLPLHIVLEYKREDELVAAVLEANPEAHMITPAPLQCITSSFRSISCEPCNANNTTQYH